MSTATKVLAKPLSLGVGMLAGALASMAFRQVWSRVAGEDEAPEPTDPEHSWREVLIAAAIQGALFGLIRAAVSRGGVVGARRLTGSGG